MSVLSFQWISIFRLLFSLGVWYDIKIQGISALLAFIVGMSSWIKNKIDNLKPNNIYF